LKNLFSEDQGRLSPQAQQRRLQEAAEILKELRTMDHQLSSEPVGADKPVGRHAESRDLWTVPIRYVKGVGPKRTALLQRFGTDKVEQPLWTVPWRYEDRSVMTPIRQLTPGAQASICGIIVRAQAKRARHRRLSILDLCVEDQTGRM